MLLLLIGGIACVLYDLFVDRLLNRNTPGLTCLFPSNLIPVLVDKPIGNGQRLRVCQTRSLGLVVHRALVLRDYLDAVAVLIDTESLLVHALTLALQLKLALNQLIGLFLGGNAPFQSCILGL